MGASQAAGDRVGSVVGNAARATLAVGVMEVAAAVAASVVAEVVEAMSVSSLRGVASTPAC